MQKLLALVIVLLLPVPALAATNTLKFSCRYTKYFDKEGAHRTDFRLTFIMDLDTGTAYMFSKAGRTQVQAGGWPDWRSWGQDVSFMEFTPSGQVRSITMVYYSGPSIHQRNTLIAGEWVTTQYYGTCVGVLRQKVRNSAAIGMTANGRLEPLREQYSD